MTTRRRRRGDRRPTSTRRVIRRCDPVLNDDDVVGNGGAGANGYGAERRVIIFASVWEHVDGVSRTMKRLAHHPRSKVDHSVFASHVPRLSGERLP